MSASANTVFLSGATVVVVAQPRHGASADHD